MIRELHLQHIERKGQTQMLLGCLVIDQMLTKFKHSGILLQRQDAKDVTEAQHLAQEPAQGGLVLPLDVVVRRNVLGVGSGRHSDCEAEGIQVHSSHHSELNQNQGAYVEDMQ